MEQINRKIKECARVIALIEGVMAIGCFFLGWCLATIVYQGDIFGVFHIVMTILSVSFYGACVNKVHKEKMREEGQFRILNLAILFISLLVCYEDITGGNGNIYFVMSDCVWIFVSGYLLKGIGFPRFGSRSEKLQGLREHIGLVVLLLVAMILALEPFQMQFRWDGALYAQACSLMNIHSLSSLGAYGHLSQAYGSLYYLFWIIVGHTGCAMTILNTVLYLGSIVGFYALILQVDKGKNKLISITATAMYAFSPFLLGMVNYYSLDYIALCLFVWVVYTAYSKKWIFHFIIALCFIFTKEPSVVVYGSFCAGLVLVEWLKSSERGIVAKVSYILHQYQYYLMLLVGIIWIAMYVMLGGWSGGVGEFSLDVSYILDKLKVLYVLNFNWLVVLGIILGIGICFIKRPKMVGLLERCFPLSLSLVMYTVFSAMFKTVNHARYAATIPVILYLLLSLILVYALRKKSVYIFSTISALMLVSSFKTIDVISLHCFQNMNTGAGTMITTGEPIIGDSMIYNKQMLRQEYVLDQALAYAINKGYRIYMPMYHETTGLFDGFILEGVDQDGVEVVTQYWDEENKVRTAYEKDNTIAFLLHEIADEKESVSLIDKNEKGCYIYSDMLGMEIAEEILKENQGMTPKQFIYDDWILYMLEF